jgi:uncharacterized protein (TIGR03435 family)
MKKFVLFIAAIWFSAGAVFAQDLSGTWQGVLKGPQEARIVVKISSAEDKLKAVLYNIDQPTPPIPASAITRDGAAVKIEVAAISGNFAGKLSEDGKSILGTWTQGKPILLNLVRATPETAWAIPDPPPPPKLMAADAKPEFEVATIKPARPDGRFSLTVNRSGMLNTTSTSVSDLLKFAYGLHPRQILNGPSWLESEKYDVTGKPDVDGLPSAGQLKMMVQKLLADRFQMAFHRDKKELSVYAITVAKSGAKITKNETNTAGLPGFGMGSQGLTVRNSTIAEFAGVLQANILEQPVVDQTGFGSTRYDFVLRWTLDPSQGQVGGPPPNAAPTPDADAPPDLFTAVQQQLGLKLESTKAPVEVLVIDRVEKPSAN